MGLKSSSLPPHLHLTPKCDWYLDEKPSVFVHRIFNALSSSTLRSDLCPVAVNMAGLGHWICLFIISIRGRAHLCILKRRRGDQWSQQDDDVPFFRSRFDGRQQTNIQGTCYQLLSPFFSNSLPSFHA